MDKLEKNLRKFMKKLNLECIRYCIRPSYPNSYKYAPPGKEYDYHILEAKGSSKRIMHKTVSMISTDKRSFGHSTYVVYGLPNIKDVSEDLKTVAREAKDSVKLLGYYPF